MMPDHRSDLRAGRDTRGAAPAASGENETLTFVVPSARRRTESERAAPLLALWVVTALLFAGLHAWDVAGARRRDADAAVVRSFARGGAIAALLHDARAKGPHIASPTWRRLLAHHSDALLASLKASAAGSGAGVATSDPAVLFPEVRAALAAAKGPKAASGMMTALIARKGREAAALRTIAPVPWADGAAARPGGRPVAALKCLLLVAGAAGLLGAGGIAAVGALLPLRTAAVAAAARLSRPARTATGYADAEPGVPLSTEDLARLAAERDRARRQLAELVARQGEAEQGTRERMREMQARIAEAERRAEASERRLRAAAVERDDAVNSLHRAALAAAVATSAALTGQGAGGAAPSPAGPRVPAEER